MYDYLEEVMDKTSKILLKQLENPAIDSEVSANLEAIVASFFDSVNTLFARGERLSDLDFSYLKKSFLSLRDFAILTSKSKGAGTDLVYNEKEFSLIAKNQKVPEYQYRFWS